MKRIAIVGSGAVGLYYGGRLAQAGHDVTFLVRGDAEGIRTDGIWVESWRGDFKLTHPQIAQTSREIGVVDLVIVAWKTTSDSFFAEVLSPLVGSATAVLTLQNGLGSADRLGDLFGESRVYVGLCFVCINRTAPGRIAHTAGGSIRVGALDSGERVDEVAALFEVAEGIDTSTTDDAVWAQWHKLVWNVPFNGLAITEGGVTTDVLLSQEKTEDRVRRLMAEVIAGAAALGKTLPDSLIEKQIEATRGMGAYRPSSMIDYVENRPVEFDAIWLTPYTRASEAGASLPEWERLIADLRALGCAS